MATRTWIGTSTSGGWGSRSNWSGNAVPGASDEADLTHNTQVSAYTAEITNLITTSIGSILITDALAKLQVDSGGSLSVVNSTLSGAITQTAGTITIAGNLSAVSYSISSTGSLSETAGTFAVSGLANLAGASDVISGGTLKAGTLSVGSDLAFNGGTIVTTANVTTNSIASGKTLTMSGGTTTLLDFTNNGANASAGVDISGTLKGAGKVQGVLSSSGNTGVVRASGGVLELTSGIAASSGLVFQLGTTSGSILQLDNSIGTGNTITFSSASVGALELSTTTALTGFGATISGLNIDTNASSTDITGSNYINLGFSIGKVTVVGTSGNVFNGTSNQIQVYATDNVTVLGTLTLDFTPAAGQYVDYGTDSSLTGHTINSGTDIFLDSNPCFTPGTRILTNTGERNVEDLREGDLVVTQQGPMAVNWIGYRKIDIAHHPRPHLVAPVRVHRGAFGEHMPERDLIVSPEHCLFDNERLIPAKRLVNGMTIVQELETRSVEYFHIELERHAILFAEGLPTESYLDTGNRANFSNAGLALVLHPEFTVNAGLKCWETDACAPLAAEAEIEPIWHKLAARAEALGYGSPRMETTGDPDLHILAGTRRIRPLFKDATRYVFALPAGIAGARLVSRAAAPLQLGGYSPDTRQLGVAVRRITIRDGASALELPADHPQLGRGWYTPERNGTVMWRWTDGDAVLPLPAAETPRILEVQLAMATRYVAEVEQPAAERLAA